MRVGALLVVLGVLSACGDDQAPFDQATSRELFDLANDNVHALHLEARELDVWPATYERPCTGGGVVDMVTAFDDAGMREDLAHAFSACVEGGFEMTGNLDYFDISFCDPTGVSLAIVGQLEVAGRGRCDIVAAETCSRFSGTACGFEL